MSSLSPTQRTLAAQRELGRHVGVVERFNRFAGTHGIRQDLFGFIDLIALDPVEGIIAIQSCGQDFAGHIRKMTEERNEAMYDWLKHAPCELWGWRKVKLKRGGKAVRWKPRIADFYLQGPEVKLEERK
jgi:predicted TIM-barrel fold metal-dependent hydrolase